MNIKGYSKLPFFLSTNALIVSIKMQETSIENTQFFFFAANIGLLHEITVTAISIIAEVTPQRKYFLLLTFFQKFILLLFAGTSHLGEENAL